VACEWLLIFRFSFIIGAAEREMMNIEKLLAGGLAFLGAALLFACGMPPIPPPVEATHTLPPHDPTPSGTRVETGTPDPESERIALERTAAAAALEAAAMQAAGTQTVVQATGTPRAATQAVAATQTASQATRQALEVEAAVAQTATAVAGAKPPLELSEAGEGGGPGDGPSQTEGGSNPSTAPQPDTSELADCAVTGPGREKVRVVNRTGAGAVLYLFGPEDYACGVETGVQRIYIRGGVYQLSSRMCGGVLYDLGENVINATWQITLRCP
jgi:hypothetical protein